MQPTKGKETLPGCVPAQRRPLGLLGLGPSIPVGWVTLLHRSWLRLPHGQPLYDPNQLTPLLALGERRIGLELKQFLLPPAGEQPTSLPQSWAESLG